MCIGAGEEDVYWAVSRMRQVSQYTYAQGGGSDGEGEKKRFDLSLSW